MHLELTLFPHLSHTFFGVIVLLKKEGGVNECLYSSGESEHFPCSLSEKFQVHSQPEKAAALEKLTLEFLDSDLEKNCPKVCVFLQVTESTSCMIFFVS